MRRPGAPHWTKAVRRVTDAATPVTLPVQP